MMVRREWNDSPEMFEDVYQALEDAGLEVLGSEEESPYGERGYIKVRGADGRQFHQELHELVY